MVPVKAQKAFYHLYNKIRISVWHMQMPKERMREMKSEQEIVLERDRKHL